MQELVACVVGLSNNEKDLFGTKPGVGKSCLCFRFAYPGYDRYIDTHPSLLALHEFENPVINSAQFLYWGSPERAFSTKGGDVKVRFHLLEQTVFYQDVTCSPFNSLTKPGNVDRYKKRIVGSIDSAGKLSYFSRDDIGMSDRYTKFQYPSHLTKQTRGYVVVFDVSLSGKELELQCVRFEPILEYLCKSKKKPIMVATKRDCYKVMSLEKAYELAKKYKVPLVETSARDSLNVEEVFRLLVRHVLSKGTHGMSDKAKGYDEAAKHSLFQRGSAKRAFQSYVKKKCQDCDDRLSSVQRSEEYKECSFLLGAYEAGRIFAQNAMELFNVKVDSYAGVKENIEMREEFLLDFVDREDFKPFKSELNV